MKGSAFLILGASVLAASAAATAAAQTATAGTGTAWLHVRVEEPQKKSRVHVNLPMGLVEAALKAAPATLEEHGRVHLGHGHNGHKDLQVSDLRRMWTELRATGDAKLVTVEGEDETVDISRKGDLVTIQVNDAGKRKGREEVQVQLPVAVVDAFLSGEGESLNLAAGIAALRQRRGDIVRVTSDDETVRIWIDEVN
jgi:hypothetical protein